MAWQFGLFGAGRSWIGAWRSGVCTWLVPSSIDSIHDSIMM